MKTADQINLPQTGKAYSTVSYKIPVLVTGPKLVFGIPKAIKPIRNAPDGKLRLRFRHKHFAMAYFKTADGIRCFSLEDCGEYWSAIFEQGRNVRKEAL